MTTEETQISIIKQLKSAKSNIIISKKYLNIWKGLMEEAYPTSALEIKNQIKRLKKEVKHYEKEISNLIEKL